MENRMKFSGKKSGHSICEKIIEYLSRKQKISLKRGRLVTYINQGLNHPNNDLDYFFIEIFDKKRQKLEIFLQFGLGEKSSIIADDHTIHLSLNQSVEFLEDKIIAYDHDGEKVWTIEEDTYVHQFGHGSIL